VIITGGVGVGIYTAVNPSQADTLAPETLQITSYRSPTCGCCHAWVEHLEAEGFTVKDNVTENLEWKNHTLEYIAINLMMKTNNNPNRKWSVT